MKLTFIGNPTKFASGYSPAIAIGDNLYHTVELHDDLDTRSRVTSNTGQPSEWLATAREYDPSGYLPTVTTDGFLAVGLDLNTIKVSQLMFCVGRWEVLPLIQWGSPFWANDMGFAPSISMRAGHMLVMFQNQMQAGPMSLKSANIDNNGNITWHAVQAFPESGGNPAVAVTSDGTQAFVVFEDGSGGLSYTLLDWSSPTGFHISPFGILGYDQGTHPRITVGKTSSTGFPLVEVHVTATGSLAYRTATQPPMQGTQWDPDVEYGSGSSPAVALTKDGTEGVEVHMSPNAQGGSDLMYTQFTLS